MLLFHACSIYPSGGFHSVLDWWTETAPQTASGCSFIQVCLGTRHNVLYGVLTSFCASSHTCRLVIRQQKTQELILKGRTQQWDYLSILSKSHCVIAIFWYKPIEGPLCEFYSWFSPAAPNKTTSHEGSVLKRSPQLIFFILATNQRWFLEELDSKTWPKGKSFTMPSSSTVLH